MSLFLKSKDHIYHCNKFLVILLSLVILSAGPITEITIGAPSELMGQKIPIPLAEKGLSPTSTNSMKKTAPMKHSLPAILLLLLSSESPTAEIKGAPSGLSNQTNPVISVGGQDVAAYRFKLDGGSYSEEIPVSQNITLSADVDIYGQTFTAGSAALQELFDYHPGYINNITFRNVKADTQVLFLLNATRVFLERQNTLYLEGSNIDQLEVYMNSTPGTLAGIIDQSFTSNPQHVIYSLSTDAPATDFVRIINRSDKTASFRFNLNNKLFPSDNDLLSAIQAMVLEYPGEPIQRKVWRFIKDNRYHWYPLEGSGWYGWGTYSPALFFNSIGFGFCDDSAELFCQIMTLLGYQARIWGLNGHVVPEVLINGKWEMYDPDLKVYYYNSQGRVAGVEELAANSDLITNPISPLSGTTDNAYSQTVADIYSSPDNVPYTWYSDNTLNNYSLDMQIPAGGILEFPTVFGVSLLSYSLTDVPYYSNARLTVPRGWTGTVNTPLVIHSIGYDGPHTLSVIARDGAGNWQVEPTIVNWTTDSWAPITEPQYSYAANPVTLITSESAIVYYTTDGTFPTTSSPVYTGPVSVPTGSVLKFFGIDTAGNRERVKYYDPATGYWGYEVDSPPPPAGSVTLAPDKISPQTRGSSITFTAMAAGGSGDYEYMFEILDLNGIWRLPQTYNSLSSWRWNTSGIDTGTYYLMVVARSKGSTEAYETWNGVYFTIDPLPLSIGASLLPAGTVETKYSQSPGASGGQTPHAWIQAYPDVAPSEMGTRLRRRPYRTNVIRVQKPQ
jgi:hypothetical protein